MQRWVAAYEEVGSRDLYLWKWCMHGVELTTLPCVVPEFRAHVCDTKVLSIVLCVLLDDVADQHGDSHLLDALLEMTCWGAHRLVERIERRGTTACGADAATVGGVSGRGLPAIRATKRSSRCCDSTCCNLSTRCVIRTWSTAGPYLLNMVEHDLYTPHNMMMISFAMLDLMCSPRFPQSDVATLREAIWHAQCMGRIGNLLSTWRRELVDSRFHQRRVCPGHDGRRLDAGRTRARRRWPSWKTTIRSRGHEAYFFRQMARASRALPRVASRIRSLDMRVGLGRSRPIFCDVLGKPGFDLVSVEDSRRPARKSTFGVLRVVARSATCRAEARTHTMTRASAKAIRPGTTSW